jgi:hypothetical protein
MRMMRTMRTMHRWIPLFPTLWGRFRCGKGGGSYLGTTHLRALDTYFFGIKQLWSSFPMTLRPKGHKAHLLQGLVEAVLGRGQGGRADDAVDGRRQRPPEGLVERAAP